MTSPGIKSVARIRVWDPAVRIGHWMLVASVLLAWMTRHGGGSWHELIGYAGLAVVCLRMTWGVFGSYHARFSSFVRGPRATLRYAGQMLHKVEPRSIGHNPLGAWMIVALLAMVVLVCLSGWLYTTDRFWGIEWVETIHRQTSNLLLALAGLHVAGVLYASFRHRENLLASMLHGRKRARTACADQSGEAA